MDTRSFVCRGDKSTAPAGGSAHRQPYRADRRPDSEKNKKASIRREEKDRHRAESVRRTGSTVAIWNRRDAGKVRTHAAQAEKHRAVPVRRQLHPGRHLLVVGWTSRPKPVISGQPQKTLHPLASLYGSNSKAAQESGRAVGSRQSAQAAGRTVNGTVQPRVTGDMHARTASGVLSFGELPDTAKLRAAGHAKIDHSIRWVQRKEDGLYLQSRYGVTRLSPVGSGILRVTFSRGEMPPVHPAIAVTRVEKNWQMREKPTLVEMRTPEMYVVADKKTGALRFLDKDSEILLEESGQDRCLIENAPNGGRSRLFLTGKKGEGLYAAGALGKGGIRLEKTARCISHGVENELPYLISDRGYGILSASSKEVIFCSLPVYGNQICLEGTQQPDYYIIVGKKLETLLKACAYLCGKL